MTLTIMNFVPKSKQMQYPVNDFCCSWHWKQFIFIITSSLCVCVWIFCFSFRFTELRWSFVRVEKKLQKRNESAQYLLRNLFRFERRAFALFSIIHEIFPLVHSVACEMSKVIVRYFYWWKREKERERKQLTQTYWLYLLLLFCDARHGTKYNSFKKHLNQKVQPRISTAVLCTSLCDVCVCIGGMSRETCIHLSRGWFWQTNREWHVEKTTA